jgi:hypothetical protein
MGAVRSYGQYDPKPSPSIVRRYMCAALLRPTLNDGRQATRALEAKQIVVGNSASAGHSRHPSALAPHSASPGPHRYQ